MANGLSLLLQSIIVFPKGQCLRREIRSGLFTSVTHGLGWCVNFTLPRAWMMLLQVLPGQKSLIALTITRRFEFYEPVHFLRSTDTDSESWETQEIHYMGGKYC